MIKKRIRVMVVEDNETVAYLIKTAFSHRGEKVDWDLCFAKDGNKLLDSHKSDILAGCHAVKRSSTSKVTFGALSDRSYASTALGWVLLGAAI